MRPTTDEPTLGSRQCLMFEAACSAVKVSPLRHLASLMVKVQVLRSSEASHLLARCGRVTLSTPVRVRYPQTWRTIFESYTHEKVCGLSIFGMRWAIRMVPPFGISC